MPTGEVVWVILIVSSMSLMMAQPVGSARWVVLSRTKGGGRFFATVWTWSLEGLGSRLLVWRSSMR